MNQVSFPCLLQMAPLGDRLLVKPQAVEKQTAGGILLSPTSGKGMQEAIVGTGADTCMLCVPTYACYLCIAGLGCVLYWLESCSASRAASPAALTSECSHVAGQGCVEVHDAE